MVKSRQSDKLSPREVGIVVGGSRTVRTKRVMEKTGLVETVQEVIHTKDQAATASHKRATELIAAAAYAADEGEAEQLRQEAEAAFAQMASLKAQVEAAREELASA